MSENYNILISKIDEFIRKYYKNQLIRGSLIFTGAVLATFLIFIFSDALARFGTTGRTIIFFSFIGICLSALAWLIVRPAIKIYKLGSRISHEQAAEIIGRHFTHVKDKIINTLQLRREAEISGRQLDLLYASVNQRITELRPVPFTQAIDLRENRRYLKFTLPPLLLLVFLLFAAPSLVTESTERIMAYDEEFKPQAPFKFHVQNNKLETTEQSDFKLDVKLTGNEIPQNVYIQIGTITYKLEKDGKINFNYLFKNVRENTSFRLVADGFESEEYTLKVLPRPTLMNFDIRLEYPKYLGKTDQKITKTGDLTVPEGTKITWYFNAKNTDKLTIKYGDSTYVLKPLVAGNYKFERKAKFSGSYTVRATNNIVSTPDSTGYFLNVIPDQYPTISVDETVDTVFLKRRYFMGEIDDDYGFTRLQFTYRHFNDSMSKSGNNGEYKTTPISISRGSTSNKFMHYWDLSEMQLNPGDQIEYYFTVYDNDGVNGPKPAKSGTKIFKVPTLHEISEKTDQNNDQIKKDMEASIKEAQKLRKEFDMMQREMMEKKNMDWQQKSKVENLMERQNELQLKLENIRKQNEINNIQKSEFTEPDPELLEKQKMLEELLDKVMNDEMQKMLEELQKLLEKMDKQNMQGEMEKMELKNEELEKELDRSLELFKQLEFEQKVEDITSKLDELSEKQEKLSEESKEKDANNKELEKKQEELNKEFEDIRKDLDELNKMNEEMERKHELENTDQQEESIQEDMKQGEQNLQNNKNKKASESQKNAAKKMQEMSNKLNNMMQSAQQQQQEEDMNALRQLLENLVKLSFDEEALIKEFTATSTRDPKYVKLGQTQRKLKDDAKLIEDSLFALSKRVVQLQPLINQEMGKINSNLGDALKSIEDRNVSKATRHQQTVMTSLNELALLLDQALQAMQQQAQAQSNPGQGNCNKPGKNKKPGNGNGNGKPGKGDKPSVQSIKQMQEQMAKQIEKLKKQMEGQQQGGNKPGNKPGMGMMPGLSKELAQSAARQQAIRQKLQELSQQLNKDGSGKGNQLKKIAEEMEKLEEDLVNKNVTIETLRRQQDIMTRLLESEKAERERGQDEKRQSNENKKDDFGNQIQLLEYKRKKEKEVELLRTIPPTLTPYYKNKVNEYFNSVE